MNHRRAALFTTTAILALTACSTAESSNNAIPIPGVDASASEPPEPVDVATSDADTATSAPATPSTTADSPTTTAAPAEAEQSDDPATSQPSAQEPTTGEEPGEESATSDGTDEPTPPTFDAFAPECVVQVGSGESLGLIVDRYDDDTITAATVSAENTIDADALFPGQLLDICVDNGLDDVTGSERERNPAIVADEVAVAVRAQQTKLNELFDGYGIRSLLVDGVSGPVTRQRLCAARLGLGLEITLTDMEPGSDEEAALFSATNIVAPFTSALNSDRWILIDRTCQIMFVGEGPTQLNNVFPTSTGSEGFETRDQDRSQVYRYDPALQNDGWHNSTTFPVAVDNPLNGNMYRPLYFDGGQAIHGANNVPTTPQSKGCARLRPSDQDVLVEWLGLNGASGPSGRAGVTVNVQGEYVTASESASTS